MKFAIRITLLSAIALFSSIHQVKAQHIRGAEIAWEETSEDTLKIMVHVYADCSDPKVYDNKILINSNCGGLKFIGAQTRSAARDITPTCDTICNTCIDTGCTVKYGVKTYTLTQLVDVSGMAGKWCDEIHVRWFDGYRYVPSIYKRSNTFSVSATIRVGLPEFTNSPTFYNDPMLFPSLGRVLITNLGAFDSDTNSAGEKLDRLHYKFECTPSTDVSTNTKTCEYPIRHPFGYKSVNYSFSDFPRGRHLDATTGRFAVLPMRLEADYTRLKVTEYRNGKKISEFYRDVLYEVIKNPANTQPHLEIDGKKNNGEIYEEIRISAGVPFGMAIKGNDKDRSDSTFISLKHDFPNPLVSKTKAGQHDSIHFSFTPTLADISGDPYELNLLIEDDNCPFPGRQEKIIKVFVDSGTIAMKRNFVEDKANCGHYRLITCPQSWRYYDSVHWYVDDTVFLGKGARFYTPNSLTKGKHVAKSVVFFSRTSQTFYDTLEVKSSSKPTMATISDTVLCIDRKLMPSAAVSAGHGSFSHEWEIKGAIDSFHNELTASPTLFFGKFKVKYNTDVTVKATDSLGCYVSQTFTVGVKPHYQNPMLDDTTFCQHEAAVLNLPNNLKSPGVWSGPGVANNFFKADSAGVGTHTLSYFEDAPTHCATENAEITIKPSPSVSLPVDFTICHTVDSTLVKSRPIGGVWQGIGLKNDSVFVPQLAGVGSHKLTYTYPTSNGCDPSKTLTITVKPNDLVVDVGNDIELCAGENSTISAKPFGGSWSSSKVKEAQGYYEITSTQADTGVYVFTYAAEDQFGCAGADTLQLAIFPKPQPKIIVDSVWCYGGDTSLLLEAEPANGQWLNKNVIIDQGKALFPINSGKLNRRIKLQYELTNAQGCSGTAIQYLNVSPKPDIQLSPFDTLCYTHQNAYLLEASPAGGLWTGTNVVEMNGEYSFSLTEGTPRKTPYEFWYSSTNHLGCADSAKKQLLVQEAVSADFEISKVDWFTDRYEVEFTNLSSANANSFIWDFGNGDTSHRKNPVYVFINPGTYSVSLISSNEYCANSITKPNLIDLNVGLERPKALDFVVVYQESEHRLYVKTESEIEQVWLTDITGKNLLSSNNWERGEQTLQLPFNVKSGVYMVSVRLQNGQWKKGKVLVP